MTPPFLLLFCIQFFPNSGMKLATKKSRKLGKTRIVKQSPEKNCLEQERKEKDKNKKNVFAPNKSKKKNISRKKI